MASTEQGASNMYQSQTLASGILGAPSSNSGLYNNFPETQPNSDMGVSALVIGVMSANGFLNSISRDRESAGVFSYFTTINTSSGSGGGTTVTTYFKMRGYYVTGSVYEVYVVTGSPSSTPPSGHTLIDVAVVSTWQI